MSRKSASLAGARHLPDPAVTNLLQLLQPSTPTVINLLRSTAFHCSLTPLFPPAGSWWPRWSRAPLWWPGWCSCCWTLCWPRRTTWPRRRASALLPALSLLSRLVSLSLDILGHCVLATPHDLPTQARSCLLLPVFFRLSFLLALVACLLFRLRLLVSAPACGSGGAKAGPCRGRGGLLGAVAWARDCLPFWLASLCRGPGRALQTQHSMPPGARPCHAAPCGPMFVVTSW